MSNTGVGTVTSSGSGMLIVISGFSGSGKSTMVRKLISKYDNYSLSISATTRKPRTGEEDGEDYFFVTREQFLDMIQQGELLEYAQYVDNYYGTPRKYVINEMKKGRDVILEIEAQGAMQVRANNPGTVLIFITPPSAAELRRRLEGRGTDSAEVIRKRLASAVSEADGLDSYDYIIVNDSLDEAVERLHRIICDQHERVAARQDFIGEMKRDLKGYFAQL